MRIVTVITDRNNSGFQEILNPSILSNNLDLDILQTDEYKNHRVKDKLLLSYLQDQDDEEIIFFTDGYDTMFLAEENEILEKFNKSGKELLFAGEKLCWPASDLSEKYPPTNSQFKYLNSGGFVGKSGFIRRCISENLQTESISAYPWSNQIYWTEQFLRKRDQIGVDSECNIFCTLVSDEDIQIATDFLKNVSTFSEDPSFNEFKAITDHHVVQEVKKGSFDQLVYHRDKSIWFNSCFQIIDSRLVSREFENSPCHIHFNGGSDVLVDNIITRLAKKTHSVTN